MEERKIRSILGQFISLRNQVEDTLNKAWTLDNTLTEALIKLPSSSGRQYDTKRNVERRIEKLKYPAKSLIDSYNNSIYDVEKTIELKLRTITFKDTEPSLNELLIECDKVIRALGEEESIFSYKETNKLKDLRDEASEVCKKLDYHFEKNLDESLIELEKGHFLASALITSRVVDYTLKKLKISDEEEIKIFIESVKKDDGRTIRKQQTEKISRLSRNLFNHRIDMYPKSSEAFSLFGDCLFLLNIYVQSNQKKNN